MTFEEIKQNLIELRYTLDMLIAKIEDVERDIESVHRDLKTYSIYKPDYKPTINYLESEEKNHEDHVKLYNKIVSPWDGAKFFKEDIEDKD